MCKSKQYIPGFSNPTFDTRSEALEVLYGMVKVINQYGFVTIADMYDMAACAAPYTANNYGWDHLYGFYVDEYINVGNEIRYVLKTNRLTLKPTPDTVKLGSGYVPCRQKETPPSWACGVRLNLEEIIEDLIKQGYHYSDPIVVKLRETYEMVNDMKGKYYE